MTLSVSLSANPWTGSVNRARRAARTNRGKPYSYAAPKGVAFRAALAAATQAAVRAQGVSFPEGVVEIRMVFSSPKRCRRLRALTCHGDLDAPLKSCFDGLVDGRAMADDVQVSRLALEKRVGPYGVEITITTGDA